MSSSAFETITCRTQKATLVRRWGQTALVGVGVVAMSTVLAACDPQKPAEGVVGYVAGFAGFVSAEEPRAVLIGEQTLSAGGTAADAAVAMASTLTVTMPGRAGWMGGGVCLSRQPKDKSVQVFSFLPQPLPGGGYAPGLPRGLYALHASSGVMRWEQILAPAEQLARFGQPVSRALAKDIATVGGAQTMDSAMQPVFSAKDGTTLREGEHLVQMRAATVMTALRIKGVGEAYNGGLARLIADDVPEYADARWAALRGYSVQKFDPVMVEVGNEVAYFPPAPFVGGPAGQVWSAAAVTEKARAEVPMMTAATPYGATGFVAVDRGGMAVSCVLSMGRMFGSGRSAGSTGLFAYAPVDGVADAQTMLPMIMGNRHVKDLRQALAGSGATAQADVLNFALATRFGGQDAQTAVNTVAAQGDGTGRVTGVWCPDGAPSHVANCTLPVDPRGSGVSRAVGVEYGSSNAKIRLN